jgi:hypothetical protein
MIHHSCRYAHFSSLLRNLRWLRSPESFQLAMYIYHGLHGLAPMYLTGLHPARRRQQPSTTALFFNNGADCPVDQTTHRRRSCISGCRQSSLEQSAYLHSVRHDNAYFPQSTENPSLRSLVPFLSSTSGISSVA